MQITDLVATAAFLTSILAALYARSAWVEARRANNISFHNNRIEIFRALCTLRNAVQVKGKRGTFIQLGVFFPGVGLIAGVSG